MNFYGVRVYDMAESIVASGFPMLSKPYTEREWEEEVRNLKLNMEFSLNKMLEDTNRFSVKELSELIENEENNTDYCKAVKHIKRALNLGSAKSGSGHSNFCKGILVSFNMKADQSFWLQWERYNFQNTVSSHSSMYCITKFDVEDVFSEYVDPRVLEVLKELIDEYNSNPTPENFHKVIHNCPEGLQLTRRVTTNYLQLKTMYEQRKHHKMFAWNKDFVRLVESLPLFFEITGLERKEE